MKKIFCLLIISLLLPIKIFGLTGSVSLACEKSNLKIGETTSCSVDASTNEEVSSVDIKITVDDGLEISDINVNSPWQGDGDNDRLQLYTANNLKGSFPIGTFKVTAESGVGTKNIKLSNIVFSDKEFKSTTFNSTQTSVKILSSQNTLKSISINGKSLENFSSDNENYTFNVDQNTNEVTIAATANDSTSKISGDIGKKTINIGTNKFVIKVTSETGAVKNYTINVIKKDDRELKSLSINDIKIDLSSGDYSYTIDINNEIDEVEVKAELQNNNNSFVQNYGLRTVSELKVGENEILLKIKDSNSNELTYKIIVKRLEKGEVPTTTKKQVTTTSSSKVDTNEDIKNPSTGDTGYIMLILIVLAVLGYAVYKLKRLKKN